MTKIRWHSPLPPAQTDIAAFTLRILPNLKSTFKSVELWTYQDSIEEISALTPDLVKSYNRDTLGYESDTVDIYNIGNNTTFHAEIFEKAKEIKGHIILHDICLFHFVAGHWLQKNGETALFDLFKNRYGQAGADNLLGYFQQKVSPQFIFENYLLTQEVVDYAEKIIVHSYHAEKLLNEMGYKNVFTIPLAFDTPISPIPSQKNHPPFRLVFLGYLHQNRRVLEFLDALATFKDKDKFLVELFGTFYEPELLQNKIKDYGLDSIVKHRGFVDDNDLAKILDDAHLAVNLRFPTMHEVSASQLYFFKHAVPTIVTNVGWYKTLPDNSCIKIDVGNEKDSIQNTLANLINNPEEFKEIGIRGQKHFQKFHLPSHYVEHLGKLVSN